MMKAYYKPTALVLFCSIALFSTPKIANAIPKLFKYINPKPQAVAKGKKNYHWVNAYAFSVASLLAYEPSHKKQGRAPSVKDRFRTIGLKECRLNQKSEFSGPVPDNVLGAHEASEVDTQYYLLYNKKVVVLVFRGSEGSLLSLADAEQRSKFIKDWIYTDANVLKMKPWGNAQGEVHRGFYWGYASVKAAHNLIPRIKKCMKHKDPHHPEKGNRAHKRALFIAGHSLGGALAQVAAFDLKHKEHIPVTGIYTYGSPRVFNRKLQNKFMDLFSLYAHRWVNSNDLVTGIPSAGSYHHAGRYHHIVKKTMSSGYKVKLDRGVHPPRTPSGADHGMINYINKIWEHMPSRHRYDIFKANRHKLTPDKIIQAAYKGILVKINGQTNF